nr:hypothetical protein [Tanacetum cinerariifolium]
MKRTVRSWTHFGSTFGGESFFMKINPNDITGLEQNMLAILVSSIFNQLIALDLLGLTALSEVTKDECNDGMEVSCTQFGSVFGRESFFMKINPNEITRLEQYMLAVLVSSIFNQLTALEMTKELDVPITNHGLWYSMKPQDFPEVKRGNLNCVIGGMAGHKISHLGKMVHHNHNRILLPWRTRQSGDKIDADVFPRSHWHW